MKLFPGLLIAISLGSLAGCNQCQPPSSAPDAAADASSLDDSGSGEAGALDASSKKNVWQGHRPLRLRELVDLQGT